MIILGIETSCDETAAAVIENGTKILSNVIASSAEMHAKSGGVIPEQAARQQIKSIIPVINEALRISRKPSKSIDAIAVTIGPGLVGSLLVGIETAKTLAYLWKKPIIPVNHLVAHIYANWLTGEPKFPILALVVSGGHTDLVLIRNHGKLQWLGGTRDDAAGEAFDKCARLLSLPYPGGPSISNEAKKYLTSNISRQPLNMFPRPLIDEENFDWSFSGLKTAVLREVSSQSMNNRVPRNQLSIPLFAAEVQEAIVDSLVEKTVKAIKKIKPKSFLLAGGVAANSRLREKFLDKIKSEKLSVIFHVPEPKYCTDNATYIAICAYFNFKKTDWPEISANSELTIMGQL